MRTATLSHRCGRAAGWAGAAVLEVSIDAAVAPSGASVRGEGALAPNRWGRGPLHLNRNGGQGATHPTGRQAADAVVKGDAGGVPMTLRQRHGIPISRRQNALDSGSHIVPKP